MKPAIILFTNGSDTFEVIHSSRTNITGSADNHDWPQVILFISLLGIFQHSYIHSVGSISRYPTNRIASQPGYGDSYFNPGEPGFGAIHKRVISATCNTFFFTFRDLFIDGGVEG